MRQAFHPRRLEYTGKVQPKPGTYDNQGQPLFPYLPDDALVEAVNLAIYLRRPLLLKGEPGCGKTRLARAVAYELGLRYEAWHVKSTSRARDGLYTYDTVGRLRDAQLATTGKLSAQQMSRVDDQDSYIRWGPLGKAFQKSQQAVLLIDEIDKADIDFPNDLLLELDEQRFLVEETGQEIHAEQSPIVFITSNDEKDLPDAFLRRCLFYYVTFPDTQRLKEIVFAHFPGTSKTLVEKAIGRFTVLREAMYSDKGELGKKVSTSELLDWMQALQRSAEDQVLSKLEHELLYPSVLLKSWDDYNRYILER